MDLERQKKVTGLSASENNYNWCSVFMGILLCGVLGTIIFVLELLIE